MVSQNQSPPTSIMSPTEVSGKKAEAAEGLSWSPCFVIWLVLGLVFWSKAVLSVSSHAVRFSTRDSAYSTGKVNLSLTEWGGSVAFPSRPSVRYRGEMGESYDGGSKRPTVVCK